MSSGTVERVEIVDQDRGRSYHSDGRDRIMREWANFRPNVLEWSESPLTLAQKFRLLEIAHETTNSEIRKAALELLQMALHPPVFATATTEAS